MEGGFDEFKLRFGFELVTGGCTKVKYRVQNESSRKHFIGFHNHNFYDFAHGFHVEMAQLSVSFQLTEGYISPKS